MKESEIIFEDSKSRWAHNILSDIKEFVDDKYNFDIYYSEGAVRVVRRGIRVMLFGDSQGMTITKDKIIVHHYEFFEKTAIKIAKEFNIPKIVRDYW